MRWMVSVLSPSLLLSTAVVACTTETVVVPAQPNDAGASSSEGATEPSPTKGSSKDGGTTRPKPDAGTTTSKPTTCRAAAKCIADCEDDDDSSCTDKCYGALPDSELAELQAISLCIADSNCTDDACVEETCAAEIETCLAE